MHLFYQPSMFLDSILYKKLLQILQLLIVHTKCHCLEVKPIILKFVQNPSVHKACQNVGVIILLKSLAVYQLKDKGDLVVFIYIPYIYTFQYTFYKCILYTHNFSYITPLRQSRQYMYIFIGLNLFWAHILTPIFTLDNQKCNLPLVLYSLHELEKMRVKWRKTTPQSDKRTYITFSKRYLDAKVYMYNVDIISTGLFALYSQIYFL